MNRSISSICGRKLLDTFIVPPLHLRPSEILDKKMRHYYGSVTISHF